MFLYAKSQIPIPFSQSSIQAELFVLFYLYDVYRNRTLVLFPMSAKYLPSAIVGWLL